MTENQKKRGRGFASMPREKQMEIASKGGKAAHAKGTAHEFTSTEAAAAGRKGGKAAHAKGTAHEFTSEEAAAAGRKGGRAAHAKGTAHRFTSQEAAAAGRKGGRALHESGGHGRGSGSEQEPQARTGEPAPGSSQQTPETHPAGKASPEPRIEAGQSSDGARGDGQGEHEMPRTPQLHEEESHAS